MKDPKKVKRGKKKILCEFCGTTKRVRTLDGKSWAIQHHPLCHILMNSTTTA